MKILCAIDGSRHSAWALELLPRLCRPADSSLLLVHAVDLTSFRASAGLGRRAREAMQQARVWGERGGRKLLEAATCKLAAAWGSVDSQLLFGRPAEVIARTAARHQVDLIVVGSRGVTEFRPLLVGSVSRKLLMKAPCPVLVVKKRTRGLRRIVVGADSSRQSWAAADVLVHMPSPRNAHSTVITAIPPLPIEAGFQQGQRPRLLDQVRDAIIGEAQKLATRIAGVIRKAGYPAEGKVAHGHPGAEIIKLAVATRADLVVVGAHGPDGAAYRIGSVSDCVVKHAPCSVLVVRSKEPQRDRTIGVRTLLTA